MLIGLASACAVAASVESLTTARHDGHYSVSLRATLDAPADTAYRVFADVAQWKQLSPDLERLDVVERHRDGAVELLTAYRVCVLWFCRLIYGVPDVFPRPRADGGDIYITIRPSQGDLRSGAAHWRFRRAGSKTEVEFTADIEPAFMVPPLIGPWFIARWMRTEAQRTSTRAEWIARSQLRRLRPAEPNS